MFELIATLPLYPKFRYDVAHHPLVDGLRFNTVTPLDDTVPRVVDQLIQLAGDKPLWLDLKTRQLRIARFAYLPTSYVTLNHRISVHLPCEVYFRDCTSRIESLVDGNQLIITRPERIVGEGEPINILDDSLQVEGFLTEQDCQYIEAFRQRDRHHYMLSFVQHKTDCEMVWARDPDAQLVAKIEDVRGLKFVAEEYPAMHPKPRLMAATDDLYLNLGRNKTRIFQALQQILAADPAAIAAPRILTSIYDPKDGCINEVSLGDLAYLRLLEETGYKTIMLSDEICRLREVFARVMEVYEQYVTTREAQDFEV